MNFLLDASWGSRFWDAFIGELKTVFGGIYTGSVNIGDEIREAILQWKGYFSIGGNRIPITDAIIISWIAAFFGILIFSTLGRKREIHPKGGQALMESLIGLLFGVCKDYGLNEEQAEKVVPMVGSMGIFLISCNLIAVFHMPPPAKNIAFPFAMAIFAIVYVIVMSIRFVGLKGFFRSFVDPKGFMVPFKIIDFVIKPISLALRLFGNVFGAFILMEFVGMVLPVLLPGVLSLWFDLMDGILQAVVFCYLTISYIGEVVESSHAVEERKHEEKKLKEEKETVAKAEEAKSAA